MIYERVDDVEEASHWIPTKDDRYKNETVTINQPYELQYIASDDQYIICDDRCFSVPLWEGHNGYFVREVGDKN